MKKAQWVTLWSIGWLLLLSARAGAEQLSLSHPQFSEPLLFNVQLPASYQHKPEKSYLLMLDFHPRAGNFLGGVHDWLSHNGEWPWLETIIVTPAPGNPVGRLFDPSGNTTPLLDFFESDLFPRLERTYRTNGFRIFSGFRVNGTLVLSALLNKPTLANAYIAVSPELKDDYAGILSSAAKKLEMLPKKRQPFLFFSHGDGVKEEHQLQDYAKLQRLLRASAPSQLTWHYRQYAHRYFMSLPVLSTIEGIELLFDDIHQGLAPDSEIANQGVEAIVEHYKLLSAQKYGFDVSPKASIQRLADYQLDKEPGKAVEILKQQLALYPEDAYSYHYLAAAYAKRGQHALALQYQHQAVALADSMLDWHKKRMKAALQEYQNQDGRQHRE
ncbi:esterase [Bowmanella sp. Y26]|uniref:esterase n=1 Tax=Bowmanella yangjiangensis TaxID=2811230 RepID=UPI001BDBDCD6|nr:esterase [Bowmanella yangjiangensis]MBT1062657.1 esterase [Bowmanella yangjiangensis]